MKRNAERAKKGELPLAHTMNDIFRRNMARPPLHHAKDDIATVNAEDRASKSSLNVLQLTGEESARFVRIVTKILRITRHYELYLLMQDEVQHFIPHQIVVSAWGNFDKWDLALHVISAIPRIRSGQLKGCSTDGRCSINSLIKNLHARWAAGGRRPLLVDNDRHEWVKCPMLNCGLQGVLQNMGSVLVHGIQNQRDRLDSLYLMFNSRSNVKGYELERYYFLADMLIAQIDAAFRKVGGLEFAHTAGDGDSLRSFGLLSARELEILELISPG